MAPTMSGAGACPASHPLPWPLGDDESADAAASPERAFVRRGSMKRAGSPSAPAPSSPVKHVAFAADSGASAHHDAAAHHNPPRRLSADVSVVRVLHDVYARAMADAPLAAALEAAGPELLARQQAAIRTLAFGEAGAADDDLQARTNAAVGAHSERSCRAAPAPRLFLRLPPPLTDPPGPPHRLPPTVCSAQGVLGGLQADLQLGLPPALWDKFLFHFERTLADLEALPREAKDRAIRCLRTGGVAA